MRVNDRSDPLVAKLLDRVEEYRRLYDFRDGRFNRDAVEHLYKKDADFTAYDVAPPVGGYVGWDAYKVGWYEVMNKYREVNFTFHDDLRVFRRGEVGWSSVSARWHGKSVAGAEFSKDIRITLVWVLENGVWLITHEHASAPRLSDLAGGGEGLRSSARAAARSSASEESRLSLIIERAHGLDEIFRRDAAADHVPFSGELLLQRSSLGAL